MSAYPGKSKGPSPIQKLVEEMIAKGVIDSGSPMLNKVAEAMLYIKARAKGGGVDFAAVQCPDRQEWTRLATGRHPVLPSEAILRMYAKSDFLTFARQRHDGDLREACFAIAQQHLRELNVAQP